MAPQPIPEEALLTGPLEATNEPYAVAKIAGIVLARSLRRQYGMNCIAVMPTNLYGPEDNFDLETSHVLPALLRRFVEAKERGLPSVTLWGTGAARREFLHVDDLAEACCFLMESYDGEELVNIGRGRTSPFGSLRSSCDASWDMKARSNGIHRVLTERPENSSTCPAFTPSGGVTVLPSGRGFVPHWHGTSRPGTSCSPVNGDVGTEEPKPSECL
jgi:nucleoside-diphosphate-sugar epimerase